VNHVAIGMKMADSKSTQNKYLYNQRNQVFLEHRAHVSKVNRLLQPVFIFTFILQSHNVHNGDYVS
jgi:hypothetical protein